MTSSINKLFTAFFLCILALNAHAKLRDSVGMEVSDTSIAPTFLAGQTATRLATGEWLLLGGEDRDKNIVASAWTVDAERQQRSSLAAGLKQARARHSATLLSDGTVLIVGGVDQRGRVSADVELFDPDSNKFVRSAVSGLLARSDHTATVLSDGTVLIIGGMDRHGQAMDEAELVNPLTGQVERIHSRLDTARMAHIAMLLPDKNVLIVGGLNTGRQHLEKGEIFDPAAQSFKLVDNEKIRQLTGTRGILPSLLESNPQTKADQVSLMPTLMLRFSRAMDTMSLNGRGVSLHGPNGVIEIRRVPVENGVLLFVTPKRELAPDSKYTLRVMTGRDVDGNVLAPVAIEFKTGKSATPSTNSNAISTGQASSQSNPAEAKALSIAVNSAGSKPLSISQISESKPTAGANSEKMRDPASMVSRPSNAPDEGPKPGGCGVGQGAGSGSDDCNGNPNQPRPPSSCAGDPVDCATGLFLHSAMDLFVADVIPIKVARSYRPRDPMSRAFGVGTNLSYDFFMIGDTHPYTYQDLILPDGGRVHFVRISPGTGFEDAIYSHTSSNTKYYGSTLRRGSGACYWVLALKNGEKICFPDSEGATNPRAAAALAITDRYGNALKLTRGTNSNLTRIESPNGRFITFEYDSKNRITKATDNLQRTVNYEYDSSGRLVKVTDPIGQSESYTWDNAGNMLTVQDKRGNLMVSNSYDSNNRVIKQIFADKTTNLFKYTLNAAGKVVQTDVTNGRGVITRMVFNANGYMTAITRALGLPEQQTTSIEYDEQSNLMVASVDPLGRKTVYTYDVDGNMLTQTLLAGMPGAVSMSRTYSSGFNQLASMTDALGHQTTLAYDSKGNLINITDANGNSSQYAYDSAGQLLQTIDGQNKRTSLVYEGSDVIRIIDPLNRTISIVPDAIGRPLSFVDALGKQSSITYDKLGRPIQTSDPLRHTITTTFDGNDNPTRIADAKGNQYGFGYDGRDSVNSSEDPLKRKESYQYDANHNLSAKIDKKGQLTQYSYDNLDRLTQIRFADGSNFVISYDLGNRVTQIYSSVEGTITRVYDDFDRVTREFTQRGSVAYSYFANGLRKTMEVAGQPVIRYSYDAGNRLIRIDQNAGPLNNNTALAVTLSFDVANRRTQTKLLNGVTANYTYDDANQLTGIVYKKADGSVIGDLTYAYDLAGRRIGGGGSLLKAQLAEPVVSATTDAANQLVDWNGTSLTYDANGNLTSDGKVNYLWNARNELVEIRALNGNTLASFNYDALGRRVSKIVNGIESGYVYDGVNIAQELNAINANSASAANIRASYLMGGVDEVFARQTGGGVNAKSWTYLTDALGSTIRLVDAAGNKLVDYSYEVYGNTAADAVVDNPFQYTGRENDGNGLYYYRARYYSPGWRRFISSDPIGLAGGINSFNYVVNDPITRTDPFGLDSNYPSEGGFCKIGPRACPKIPPLNNKDFKKYYGVTTVFHCGFQVYMGKSRSIDNTYTECVYDDDNELVDENSIYYACRGTNDEYSADLDFWKHALMDKGGPNSKYTVPAYAVSSAVAYGRLKKFFNSVLYR